MASICRFQFRRRSQSCVYDLHTMVANGHGDKGANYLNYESHESSGTVGEHRAVTFPLHSMEEIMRNLFFRDETGRFG
jgi:hypothetical protein